MGVWPCLAWLIAENGVNAAAECPKWRALHYWLCRVSGYSPIKKGRHSPPLCSVWYVRYGIFGIGYVFVKRPESQPARLTGFTGFRYPTLPSMRQPPHRRRRHRQIHNLRSFHIVQWRSGRHRCHAVRSGTNQPARQSLRRSDRQALR